MRDRDRLHHCRYGGAGGDKLQLDTEEDNGDETDTGLQADSYTIVGLVETPYYLSFSLGTSSIGSGRVGLYAYVLPDEFIVAFIRFASDSGWRPGYGCFFGRI